MQTLTKPWNKAPAGTEITDDPAEAKKGGKKVVLVDSARLAHLAKHGFFRVKKEAEILPPGQPVKPPRVGPGDHHLRPEASLLPAPDAVPPRKADMLATLAKEGKNVIDPRLDVVVEDRPNVEVVKFDERGEPRRGLEHVSPGPGPGLPEPGPTSPRHDSGPKGGR